MGIFIVLGADYRTQQKFPDATRILLEQEHNPMKLKDDTVKIDGLQAPMLRACAVVDEAFLRHARHEVTMTSAKDGKHSDESLHYKGLAGDFRTRDVTPNELVLIFAEVRAKLPPPYEVIDEKTHMHVEHDQKG